MTKRQARIALVILPIYMFVPMICVYLARSYWTDFGTYLMAAVIGGLFWLPALIFVKKL